MQYNILNFDTLTSTNDEASMGHYTHGDVIVAQQQSSGRGQRGNRWSSVPGESLTFSLVLEPTHIAVDGQFALSEMAALAASKALNCLIKWPNDLYVGDNKLGGILIEHCSQGPRLTKTIIGVGINVLQQKFPSWVPNPTSLKLLGQHTTAERVLRDFCTSFSDVYLLSLDELHRQFCECLWRAKGLYTYRDGATGELFKAEIYAINPRSGELTLRDEQGHQRHYFFKEVDSVI
ncbi:MAG: biotin--[acetyl-CoA-carboxylase] ligase [Mucinivorans sp.]